MNLKKLAKAQVRTLFEAGQSLGLDILPRHFYSEIPDIRSLKKSQAWRRPYTMPAINGSDIASQTKFVETICSQALTVQKEAQLAHENAKKKNGHDGYGPIESQFLYSFIFAKRPRTIFQIGCGVSTAVILDAAEKTGYKPEVICVEPYPNQFLSDCAANGKIKLISTGAESLELSHIENLPEDTFFFVDSSHTLGPAGEVTRIVVEMLPRLKKNCWVHFHDIYFPYDYDRHILSNSLFFSHETPLLMAFLSCNDRFSIAASFAMLHYAAPAELAWHVPGYEPSPSHDGLATGQGHFPSSLYLRTK